MRPTRDPAYWGRHFWFTMHTVALFYPDFPTADDMSHARNFFLSLQGLIPCGACAYHYQKLLLAHPLEDALQSKMELSRWVWRLHNEVNARLGKSVIAFDDYMTINQADTPHTNADPLLWGVVLAAVIVLLARTLLSCRRV